MPQQLKALRELAFADDPPKALCNPVRRAQLHLEDMVREAKEARDLVYGHDGALYTFFNDLIPTLEGTSETLKERERS